MIESWMDIDDVVDKDLLFTVIWIDGITCFTALMTLIPSLKDVKVYLLSWGDVFNWQREIQTYGDARPMPIGDPSSVSGSRFIPTMKAR